MALRSGAVPLFVLLATLCLFELQPARAADLDLSSYKGKVVYLDFWASWCTPCRQSFPWMSDVQGTLGSKGLVVIGVNVDHDHALAEEFLQANAPQFRIVFDPDGAIAGKYNFKDMPTSILIGRDGRVRYVHNGFYPNREDHYLSDIDILLKEKGP
jgi:cytochrome c biogenesis protein CcmG/thiol:disulfide interchange protein DsbE